MAYLNNKKTGKFFLYLFSSDKIPNDFYAELITTLKSFDYDKHIWNTSFIGLWKNIKRDLVDDEFITLKEYIRKWFIKLFETNVSQGIKKLNSLNYKFNIDELEQLKNESYTNYESFFIYGCPLSTDIDVLVTCPEQSARDGKVCPLFTSEIVRLKEELSDLGYDINREIDYNLVVIRDDVIIASSKGGKETANICLATYKQHAQKFHDLPLKKIILSSDDFEDKLRSLAKFVWDFLKNITSKNEYKNIQDVRRFMYTKPSTHLMTELNTIIPLIIHDPKDDKIINIVQWRTRFKSITMKLIQIIVYHINKTTSYNKLDIALDSKIIVKYYETNLSEEMVYSGSLYNLTRGTQGEYQPNLFYYLIDIYQLIVIEVLRSKKRQIYFVDMNDKKEIANYKKSLFSDDDAVKLRCTERSIIFTVLGIVSFVCGELIKALKGEEIRNYIVVDYKLPQVI